MSDVGLETSIECTPPVPPAAPGLSGAPSNVAELYAMLAAEIDRGARRLNRQAFAFLWSP